MQKEIAYIENRLVTSVHDIFRNWTSNLLRLIERSNADRLLCECSSFDFNKNQVTVSLSACTILEFVQTIRPERD